MFIFRVKAGARTQSEKAGEAWRNAVRALGGCLQMMIRWPDRSRSLRGELRNLSARPAESLTFVKTSSLRHRHRVQV